MTYDDQRLEQQRFEQQQQEQRLEQQRLEHQRVEHQQQSRQLEWRRVEQQRLEQQQQDEWYELRRQETGRAIEAELRSMDSIVAEAQTNRSADMTTGSQVPRPPNMQPAVAHGDAAASPEALAVDLGRLAIQLVEGLRRMMREAFARSPAPVRSQAWAWAMPMGTSPTELPVASTPPSVMHDPFLMVPNGEYTHPQRPNTIVRLAASPAEAFVVVWFIADMDVLFMRRTKVIYSLGTFSPGVWTQLHSSRGPVRIAVYRDGGNGAVYAAWY